MCGVLRASGGKAAGRRREGGLHGQGVGGGALGWGAPWGEGGGPESGEVTRKRVAAELEIRALRWDNPHFNRMLFCSEYAQGQ
jgi:hypothetical protein